MFLRFRFVSMPCSIAHHDGDCFCGGGIIASTTGALTARPFAKDRLHSDVYNFYHGL